MIPRGVESTARQMQRLAWLFSWVAGLALAAELGAQDVVDGAAGQSGTQARWDVLERYCQDCHNFEDYAGGVAFDTLPRDDLHGEAEIWEAAIRKLRTGMMPPADEPRPARAVLDDTARWLETTLDAGGVTNPGAEGLSRLNRSEYINAVRDLLVFDATRIVEESLPADASVEGFDNMASGLAITPTLMESYLSVAMEISRLAVGDTGIGATDIHYTSNGGGVQLYHIDGQPLGTRGGMRVEHHFPVDGEYVFRVSADLQEAGWKNDQGRMWWCDGPAVNVAFNGRRVPVDDHRRFRLKVPAGPQEIAVSLVDVRKCAGAAELYLGEALASVGGAIRELEIQGPFDVTGVGDTPSRRRIFICEPAAGAGERSCAREILANLATRAYRRPVSPGDGEIDTLMAVYDQAREEEGGDFEMGIQYALARLLVDPRFLYRFEREPADVAVGEVYRISDLELASRLSFFLWSSLPDDTLLGLAAENKLGEPGVLEAQVRRMLADERSQALVDNFAGQWLELRGLADASPQDETFDEALRRAFRRETELFFADILRGDSSVLRLLDAGHTYLNERLAKHYGINGVRGSYMRRVELPPDSHRGGLLGHGSILTATSNPNRTSPVVRGVWVVESLLGAPVPEPPPGVETNLAGDEEGGQDRPETLRGRLEQHRADPACAGCHGIMDPVGLALENFDLVGRWRETDNGLPIDAASTLTDGTVVHGPAGLRRALLARPRAFVSALTEKLLSYALGRPVEYYDGPAVRRIVRQAAEDDYSFASLIQGIVASNPFQKRVKTGEAATPGDLPAAGPQ